MYAKPPVLFLKTLNTQLMHGIGGLTMPKYIDADALKDDALNYIHFERVDGGEIIGVSTLNGIRRMIDNAPAADVETVRHGQWVLVGTNEHDYETSVEEKCSLCGRYVYRYDTQPQDNYCPNCGARMDGEV
jgi:hypothetical protein